MSDSSEEFEEVNASNSSFELLNGNGSQRSSPETGKAVMATKMEVDGDLWMYMKKRGKYAEAVELVVNDCRVSIDLESASAPGMPDHLLLTGDADEQIETAQHRLNQLIDDCRKNVTIRALPPQTELVFENILDNMDRIETGAQVSVASHDNKVVRVIGTEQEVGQTIDWLREKCALEIPVVQPAPEDVSAGEITGGSTEDPDVDLGDSLVVQDDLWKYIQKNPQYSDDLRRVKEEMHVDIVETVSDGKPADADVRLLFSGGPDDVTVAMETTKKMIENCRRTTTTIRIECANNQAFSKVVRFLPIVNKSAGYVSAADGVVMVTGTKEEQAVCETKKKKVPTATLR